ncbi:MAG: sulfatase [Candidatus Nanohaloarchaea archaeon]
MAKKPNVLFVVLDSLRRDRVSVYNDDVDFTESLEEFSKESRVYRQAVASAPWTFPSHASMFTGMRPWEHGATQRNLSLDVEKDLMAERLSSEGYRTRAISTNVWLSGRFGLMKGFEDVDNLTSTGFSERLSKIRRRMDEWLSSPGQDTIKRTLVRIGNKIFHYWFSGSQTGTVIERGQEFMDSDEEPFFLFLNLMDAHEPYFPPQEYLERHDCVDPGTICQNPTDFHAGREEPDFDEIRKIYDASVDYMDDQLGELFQHLKDRGKWEDTVVVVVSDHGQLLGEDGLYGHQYSVAEELVSVPMMVKGGEAGEVEEQVELSELRDIVLSATGVSESYEEGTEYAMGGYEFPDVQRPRIPRDRWKEFYRRHHFVRTLEGRVTRSEDEDGEVSFSSQELAGELTEEEREEMREKLEAIDGGEEGEQLDEKEEEIQEKLRELGYG